MKNLFLVLCGLFVFSNLYGQLEFTSEKKILFVGTKMDGNKKIVTDVYISPIDSFNLNLKIGILQDWKKKDSLESNVTLDKSSLNENNYFLKVNNISYPAYRFYDKSGLEILISKERYFENKEKMKKGLNQSYSLNFVQIILPKNRKNHIDILPIMYQK